MKTVNAAPTVAITQKKGFCSFYSKGEEIFNAVSHIVGGAFGLAVWITLTVFSYPSATDIIATSVFAASIVILYTMSALYRLTLSYSRAYRCPQSAEK